LNLTGTGLPQIKYGRNQEEQYVLHPI